MKIEVGEQSADILPNILSNTIVSNDKKILPPSIPNTNFSHAQSSFPVGTINTAPPTTSIGNNSFLYMFSF